MTDFSLPDFGMLLGLRELKPSVATQNDIVKPSLEDNAPFVEYGEVRVAFNELPTQIQDFEEPTSSASSNGSDRMQQLHAGLAFGVTPNGEYAEAAPFLPVPIDDMVAADHVPLKSEYDMHHYGGDCFWSPDTFTTHSYVNQLSRRWSSPSPSYPSASETYAMQCAGFDDCGCAPNRTSPFMVGDVVSCEPFQVHSYPTDLQFAGSQQALVDMCDVLDPTRTVQTNHPATCYKPFSHVRAKSTSFTEDLLRCTSTSDDLATTSRTEELDETRPVQRVYFSGGGYPTKRQPGKVDSANGKRPRGTKRSGWRRNATTHVYSTRSASYGSEWSNCMVSSATTSVSDSNPLSHRSRQDSLCRR